MAYHGCQQRGQSTRLAPVDRRNLEAPTVTWSIVYSDQLLAPNVDTGGHADGQSYTAGLLVPVDAPLPYYVITPAPM